MLRHVATLTMTNEPETVSVFVGETDDEGSAVVSHVRTVRLTGQYHAERAMSLALSYHGWGPLVTHVAHQLEGLATNH